MNDIIIPNTGAVINMSQVDETRAALEKAIADFGNIGEITTDNAERAVLAKNVLSKRIKTSEDARRATDRAIDALLVDNVPGLKESRALIDIEREAKKIRDTIADGIKALEPPKPRKLYVAFFFANDKEMTSFEQKANGRFNPRTGKTDPAIVSDFKFWDVDSSLADKICGLIAKRHGNDVLV